MEKEYVAYKGESFIGIGTIDELAEVMEVLPSTVYFYTTPTYQKRISKRKKARNYITVTKIDENDNWEE